MSVAALLDRRARLSDVLMNYHFHVLDVSVSQPSVLSLLYGFQNCSGPEISVNTKKIKDGSFPFGYEVFESAEVSQIELSSGAKFFDSDFYDWIISYIRGQVNTRRDFLIIQYSQVNVNSFTRKVGVSPLPSSGFLAPIFDVVGRVPARAWLCRQCIPITYKVDGFDALSHQPSLQHLTLKPMYFEEFNTGV